MLLRRLGRLCIGVAALAFASLSAANSITITINTPTSSMGLGGRDAILAFDLIDGGTLSSNTVTLSGFSTDGFLGSAYLTHDPFKSTFDSAPDLLSGVTFSDTDFFTESGQAIQLGSTLAVTIDLTENLDSAPDQLTVFLLDPMTFLPLVLTEDDDPVMGANALLRYSLGEPNQPVLFAVKDDSETTITMEVGNIPEPATLLLLAAAMLGAAAFTTRLVR